jgi:hypothetical protein
LIKGKRPSETAVSIDGNESDSDEDEEDEDEGVGTSVKQKKKNAQQNPGQQQHKKHLKTHPDLAAITFLGTQKTKSFESSVSANVNSDMMASFSEGKAVRPVESLTCCIDS